MARECMADIDTAEKDSDDFMKLYVKCNTELLKIYVELIVTHTGYNEANTMFIFNYHN